MTRRRNITRAFSLVEVLLAIFILGIGVIAVAALFPAGIAQQRQSVDDIIGPVVANNALSIIRTKLSPDDFGTFEEFGVGAPLRTVEGDWPWMRPGTARADIGSTPEADERGWYDVFSQSANAAPLNSTSEFGAATYVDPISGAVSSPPLVGIPYNRTKHGDVAPAITISQGSRYYPMAQADEFVAFVSLDNPLPRPQYVWDCMFRRYQGRILVAIFVYRVTVPGGDNITYRTPHISQNVPPLPVKLQLDASNAQAAWDAFGPDGVPRSGDEAFVLGTPGGTAYDAANKFESWQEPRQWLLDDNNNIHRVLSFSRDDSGSPVEVELVRPMAEVAINGFNRPMVPTTYLPAAALDTDAIPNGLADQNIVSSIFYIPAEIAPTAVVPPNSSPLLLTPVYVTVREL